MADDGFKLSEAARTLHTYYSFLWCVVDGDLFQWYACAVILIRGYRCPCVYFIFSLLLLGIFGVAALPMLTMFGVCPSVYRVRFCCYVLYIFCFVASRARRCLCIYIENGAMEEHTMSTNPEQAAAQTERHIHRGVSSSGFFLYKCVDLWHVHTVHDWNRIDDGILRICFAEKCEHNEKARASEQRTDYFASASSVFGI